MPEGDVHHAIGDRQGNCLPDLSPVVHRASRTRPSSEPAWIARKGPCAMASYVTSSSMHNETPLYAARLHWIAFVKPALLAIVLAPITWGASLLLLAFPVLDRIGTELAITDRRVIAKWGIIRRQTIELRIDRVEGLKVQQSVLGRLLGYGTIVLAGTGSTQTPIPNIADPIAFRQKVYETQDAAPGRPAGR